MVKDLAGNEYGKRCPGCGDWKDPLTEFTKDNTKPNGVGTYCHPCKTAHRRKCRQKPEARAAAKAYNAKLYSANPRRMKEYALKAQYNVTLEWFDRRVAELGNACERCRTPFASGSDTHLDHNHDHCSGCSQTAQTCGSPDAIRGILCGRCSALLSERYCLANPNDTYLMAYTQRRAALDTQLPVAA